MLTLPSAKMLPPVPLVISVMALKSTSAVESLTSTVPPPTLEALPTAQPSRSTSMSKSPPPVVVILTLSPM